jgi:hypothetical protein
MTALLIGVLLAVVSLAFVLAPLFGARTRQATGVPDDDALEAMIRRHRGDLASCPACGPRPEIDARFCSSCGRDLTSSGS